MAGSKGSPRWGGLLPGPWMAGALRYALQGCGHALATEHHIRFLLLCAAVVASVGGIYRLSLLEWALVVLSVGSVLAAELMNTAIEAVVDLASPGQHPLAQRAKDLAAAAVFVSIVGAVAVGLLVFLPHFLGRR
ncbi:MAG: diacylglycerol kinase family protein [Chloroflexi bacterium]|nr:diacylglycerol kinase family protein [Chloroflexota bacterium]